MNALKKLYNRPPSDQTRRASSSIAIVAALLAVFDADARTPVGEPEGIPPRLVAFVGPHYTALSLSSLNAIGISQFSIVGSQGLAGLDLRVGAELLEGDLCLLIDIVFGFSTTDQTTSSITAKSETETTPAEITTSTTGVQYTTTLWQLGLSGRWNARRPRADTMVPFIGGRAYYEYTSTNEEFSGVPTLEVDYARRDPVTHGFGVQLSMGLEYLFNAHLGLGVEGMLGYGARFHEESVRSFKPGTSGFSSGAEKRSDSDTTRTEHGLSWRTILTLSFRL